MHQSFSRHLLMLAFSPFFLVCFSTPAQRPTKQSLSGHVPAAAKSMLPAGRMPGNEQLTLAIGLPLRNRGELNNLLQQLYDPTSPNYRQYLTPEQFTARFGPSEQDYEALMAFAQYHGLRVSATHPNRMLLNVRGSIADIENTFQVTLRLYQHPKEARQFFAPDREPVLDLSVPVLHISGLNNYVRTRPANLQVKPLDVGGEPGPVPALGTGPSGTYIGNNFRNAYVRGTSLTGAGQMVGLLQFDGYYSSDITGYVNTPGSGISTVPPLIKVLLDGFDGTPGVNNVEVALDIEMTMSMAPGLSAIIVYTAGNSTNSFGNDILNRMATDNLAKQLSSSWTFGIDPTTTQIFDQFAAQGQSYFNADGDNGAFTSGAAPPSDFPNIISVGGTTLTTAGGNGSWLSETVWNWNSTGQGTSATGGGISTAFTIPSWQQGIDMTANQGSTTMRNVPDVAMVADNVYAKFNNGQGGGVAGTSVGSPLWAGFTALINQQSASLGQPPVGFLNPALYAIGKGAGYSTNFHDTTTGNNTNAASPDLFFAVAGYDLCTGWGSPVGTNLINTLAPRPNASVITNAGSTVAFEGCSPANGAIDPGETVTLNFSLKNIGAIRTTNLVATLLADSAVLSPSAPQSYGALTGGGNAVSRPFTFTAAGSCGGTMNATLQLQDGSANLGNLVFTFGLGKPVVVITQNFDSVFAPSLPSGWTTASIGGVSNWVTSASTRDTPQNSAFAAERTNAGITELVSPIIPITTDSAQLTFRNNYNCETDPVNLARAFDGGVLEISLGGGPFMDILAAGGSFVSGAYNRTITSRPMDDNPLAGREAWSGLSGGFITTTINLPANAAGQSIQLKWRLATDSGNFYGGFGWYIDGIAILDGFTCCNSIADLALSQSASPDPAVLGQNLTYTIAVTNIGPEPAFSTTVTDVLPGSVTFSSASPGCIFTNGMVICSVGSVAAGGISNVTVTVTPQTLTPITNVITISSVTSDPSSANNSNSIVTLVSTNSPPIITGQPTNITTVQGSNAVLQVMATGAPSPAYQWFFNGSNVPGATSNVLTLNNVQASQIGDYHAVVTNPGGSVTSQVARLTVLVPPTIQLAGVSMNGTNVAISLNSVSGLNYILEYKNALTDPNWTIVLPQVSGTGSAITLLDTNAISAPMRFYRVNVR